MAKKAKPKAAKKKAPARSKKPTVMLGDTVLFRAADPLHMTGDTDKHVAIVTGVYGDTTSVDLYVLLRRAPAVDVANVMQSSPGPEQQPGTWDWLK